LESAEVDIINFSAGLYLKPEEMSPPWVFGPAPHEQQLLDSLSARGVLLVAAAGNQGPKMGSINWPAGLDDVLAVGEISAASGRVQTTSSRGPFRHDPTAEVGGCDCFDPLRESKGDRTHRTCVKPDVAAPGHNVMAPRSEDYYARFSYPIAQRKRSGHRRLRDSFGGRYRRDSGTSQATAVVSGLAACLLQYLRDSGLKLSGRERATVLRQVLIAAAERDGRYREEEVGAGVLRWPAIARVADELVLSRLGGDLVR
jgi:subtilisin family serine protease